MAEQGAQAWQHYNPVRLLSGIGVAQRLGDFLPTGRVLLLTSTGMVKRGQAQCLTQACPAADWLTQTIAPNPDLDALDDLCGSLRAQQGPSVVAIVAFGGGSVIDAAKALALGLRSPYVRPLQQWLREGQREMPDPLPLFCLPTTAGTGAEVTPFATVWDGRSRKKCSLADERLFPVMALLDAQLTRSLPWRETLYTALDTTSHALETLWNRYATPISRTLAIEALRGVVKALPAIESRLDDITLREQLQTASVLAGFAISQSRTALAHAMSYPLTAHYGVPHGLACSFTLPALIRRVRAANAFPQEVPQELLDAVIGMLESYEPGKALRGYCTPDAVLGHVGEMFDPARVDNFLLEVNEALVQGLVVESLKMGKKQ